MFQRETSGDDQDPARLTFKARLKSADLTGWEGGLPPPQIEWRSASGGKPTFPTIETPSLNHPLRLRAPIPTSFNRKLCFDEIV